MADHINRWNHVSSLSLWKHNLDRIRYFAADRPGYVWGHYVDYFDLSDPYAIEIDMQSTGTPSEVDEDTLSAPGYIRLNTLELGPFEGAQKGYQRGVFESAFEKPDILGERLRIRTAFPWEGTYFGGVNVNLEATARDGYLFDVWEINGSHFIIEDSLYTNSTTVLIEDPEINIISYEPLHITAHYLASTGHEPPEPELPLVLQLGSNYPNPFNPTTVIPFTLPENGQVRLDVFDVTGRLVGTFLNRELVAGRHEVSVNLSGVSSGVYIYHLQAGGQTASGKMLLLK
jgi:hypothetical protein